MNPIVLSACLNCITFSNGPTIQNFSGLSNKVVEDTFIQAQQIFVEMTKCQLPKKGGALDVYDMGIGEMNLLNNVFNKDGSVSIVLGVYKEDKNAIIIVRERPDRKRTLFHEFIHYLFAKSPNCYKFGAGAQHAVIPEMEQRYFKKNKMLRDEGVLWLIRVLKENYYLRDKE